MGRIMLKLIGGLACVWSVWWLIATSAMVNRVDAWINAQIRMGGQASVADMSRAGYPFRAAVNMGDLALEAPQGHATLQVPQFVLSTPIYWPWHLSLQMSGPVTVDTLAERWSLNFGRSRAGLNLVPGLALQLDRFAFETVDIGIGRDGQPLLEIAAVDATIQQTTNPSVYSGAVDLAGLTFTKQPGSVSRLTQDLLSDPLMLNAAFQLAFQRPWDRTALAGNSPQLQRIDIETARMDWGDLNLRISAGLDVDPAGVLDGAVQIRADEWRRVLATVVDVFTTPDNRQQIEAFLPMLAGLSDTSDQLDLEITIDGGRMRMGFIPLGQAPRILLR